MKRTIRHLAVDIGKRIAAAFICLAIVLSAIGPWQAKAAGEKRHIVLVLDASGRSDFYNSDLTEVLYSASSPIEEVKAAALKFADSLQTSGDDVYVSIISYGDTAHLVCDFTNDYSELKTSIQNLWQIGGRKNLGDGLAYAQSQFDTVMDIDSTKSLILVSPGMDDEGEYNYSGHWSTSDIGGNWYNLTSGIRYVAYSNVSYERAEALKASGVKIYGIGIMQMMENCPESVQAPAQLFQNVLRDLSSEGCYYPVYNIDNFEFVFGQMTQDIVTGSKGQFQYASMNGGDYTANYYFQDAYFDEGASKYNPSLATMSMCLAMSAFKTKTGGDQYKNAYNLLKKIGFDTIKVNDDYMEEPNVDTMGVIIGYRNIENIDGECTLIALATRGSGYGNEWAGNFDVGDFRNHAGFQKAKDVAKKALREFVDEYGKDFKGKVKLWMTGYSRAAATVNLLAGEITNDKYIGQIHSISIEKEDIYAYCFEPPRGLNTTVCSEKDAVKYTNIHNIVNPNDFVPKVAMREWLFIRYGVDENVIPEKGKDADYRRKVAGMMSFYSKIGGKNIGETFVSLSEYEAHYDEVFEKIVAYAEGEYIAYRMTVDGHLRMSLSDLDKFYQDWNNLEIGYRKTLASAYAAGKEKCKLREGVIVDFKKVKGYGIFTSAYYYRLGLIEMRRLAKQRITSGPEITYTDVISKIDLFRLSNYKSNLHKIRGILEALSYYEPDFSTTLGQTLTNVLPKITREIGDRRVYCYKIQDGLKSVLREVFKAGGELNDLEFEFVKACNLGRIIITALDLVGVGSIKADAKHIYDNIVDYLKDKGVDINKVVSEYNRERFKEGIGILAQGIANIVGTQSGTDEILSLAEQADYIGMAHYPELCFAWLMSQDKNYAEVDHREYTPYRARRIYINCPVDVVAVDSNGVIVASLQEDISQETEGYTVCGIDSNGAKIVYLPTNEAYTVTITAREDCTMSFSINETDADEECDYIENYYDIPMKKGETITVSLPQEFFVDEEGNVTIVEGDNVLRTKSGTVDADVILRGDDAKAARYTIAVESNNTAGGVCFGGDEYVLGNYAMVSAAEYEDCTFVGWYEGDDLVSTEREYRFCVTGDRLLSAHFEGETVYGQNGVFQATISAGENGFVNLDDDYGEEITVNVLDGYAFEVTAAAKAGYEFIGWEVDGNCLISDTDAQTTEITLIDEDVTVIAKFKEYTEEGPTGPTDPIDDPTGPTGPTETGDDEIVPINGVSVSYRTDSTWTGGYNGSITITNNSGRDINDWKMVFDMNGTIAGFWNAVITKNENGQYFITNSGWNGKLSKGQSITIGFTAVGNSVVAPTNFRVYEKTAQPVNTGTDPVATANVEFKTTATWNGGCNGELVITNTSGTALKNWQVTFTCTGQVNSVWNGRIVSRNGQTYVVGDDGSHSTIAPGATIRIGMNLNANGSGAYPKDFTVSGK